MKYLFIGLSIAIITTIINGIAMLKENPTQDGKNIVYISKFVLIIGIVCGTLFLIPVIILLLTDYILPRIILFSSFSLLSVSLIIAYCNCRISYDASSFEVKNFWGVKRNYSYDSITAIRGDTGNVTLYVGKDSVKVYEYYVGNAKFLSFAKKQYMNQTGGKLIPKVKSKSKFDLFNGNVKNPGEFLFIYILIAVLSLGANIRVVVSSNESYKTEAKALSYTHYEIVDNDLHLYSADDSLYYNIPKYKKLIKNSDNFLSQCDKGASFKITCWAFDDRYDVLSITGNDGKIYLSESDTSEYYRKNILGTIMILAGVNLLWLAYVIVSVYVGRHPKKFSKQFIRLFFKESSIKSTSL